MLVTLYQTDNTEIDYFIILVMITLNYTEVNNSKFHKSSEEMYVELGCGNKF